MQTKIFFVVSRSFQVERYLVYINQLNLKKNEYMFICVSQWTNGDALEKLNTEPTIIVEKPRVLKKKYFANYKSYVACIVLAWCRLVRNNIKLSENFNSIVFIDQYFSPVEFLAISYIENIKSVIVHQHSLNFINQIMRSKKRAFFEYFTHKLLHYLLRKFLRRDFNYYVAAYSQNAMEYLSSMNIIKNAFPINYSQKIDLNYTLSNKEFMLSKGTIFVIVSPGMFRYQNKSLIKAQIDFFSKAYYIIQRYHSDAKIIIRGKPGEKIENFQDSCNFDFQYLDERHTFSGILDYNATFVCAEVSTTWYEVVSRNKSCIIIRQAVLRREYPFFSELLDNIVTADASLKEFKKEGYLIVHESNIKLFCKSIDKFLNLALVENPVEIKDMIKCIKL